NKTRINIILPKVRMVHVPDNFKVIYGTDEKDLKDLQDKGIRNVTTNHTTYDGINQIASDIGLDVERPKNKVLVVLEEASKVNRENFDRQIYKYKTLVSKDEFNEIGRASCRERG